MHVRKNSTGPCDCRYLEYMAHEPDGPIRFDPRTNEYHILYHQGGREGSLVLYCCPLCGGAAPTSIRETLFQVVSGEEKDRLFALFLGLTSLEAVIARLGPPDADLLDGGRITSGDAVSAPQRTEQVRTLYYRRLSAVANVGIAACRFNGISVAVTGKPKDEP